MSKLVGLVGWRGMVGSVLMDRMVQEGDFDLIEPLFFSTSNAGGAAPAQAKNEATLKNAHDIAALLDSSGICIRSGHHCTQPLHRHYGLSASARASLSFTTTPEEIDRFAEELQGAIGFLREHS